MLRYCSARPVKPEELDTGTNYTYHLGELFDRKTGVQGEDERARWSTCTSENCQDICSARTTHYDTAVLYCIVWRFTWIWNRQYRQLRRLCCGIWIHFVFTLPEALLQIGASFCCSAATTACYTAALPSGYERTRWIWFRVNHVFPFQKRVLSIKCHGWITLQRSLMHEDGLGKVMSGEETAAIEEDATQLQRAQYTKESRRWYEERNGKLFTTMLRYTAALPSKQPRPAQ